MPADKADGEGQVLPARKAPLRPPRDPLLLAFWGQVEVEGLSQGVVLHFDPPVSLYFQVTSQ